MKKRFILLLMLFILTQNAFAGHSVLSKNQQIFVDKAQPFFINIYADNGYDIDADFDEPVLANNMQVHFFNKPFDSIINNSQNSDNFFISAQRLSQVDLFKSHVESVEFMSNYKSKKWDLSGGVYQETISGLNQYHNYISVEPTYRLSDKFAIYGGMAHSVTDNHDQTSFGIKYNPLKSKRLEFKLGVVNYTKQYTSYRNRLNFETAFKI